METVDIPSPDPLLRQQALFFSDEPLYFSQKTRCEFR